MDFNKLTLFGMVKDRMQWLSKRQEVLAQNVANADTPDYKPLDLKAIDFADVMRQRNRHAGVSPGTAVNTSVAVRGGRSTFDIVENRAPYETSPDGNAVVLEEQMAKIGETQMQHQLTNELYRKHLGMIKIAIGKGR